MEDKSSFIKSLMKQNFKDSSTKSNKNTLFFLCYFLVSKDGLKAYCHLLELFVREGVIRAQNHAKSENSNIIEFENLENVFVQLLLDF